MRGCYNRGTTISVMPTTSRRVASRLWICLPLLIDFAACQRGIGGAPIKIDGSSTLYPLTSAVAADFKTANPGATVDVRFSGTDIGFAAFCKGYSDIQDASRPIEASEIAACRDTNVHFIELPVAYDGLTVIINPSNTWAEAMTVRELKALWEPAATQKITKWSELRAGWPDEPITLFGPGQESGTFDFFTEAIVGDERKSRTDYTTNVDDAGATSSPVPPSTHTGDERLGVQRRVLESAGKRFCTLTGPRVAPRRPR